MAFTLALIVTGVYALDRSLFDVGIALAVGVIGYGLRYFGVPQLPMVLGTVLGFLVESNYRRSLQLSGGEHGIFFTDPVSLGLLLAAAVLLVYSLAKRND
jgi:putative tricarboxylic transport membrane protein